MNRERRSAKGYQKREEKNSFSSKRERKNDGSIFLGKNPKNWAGLWLKSGWNLEKKQKKVKEEKNKKEPGGG